MGLGILGGNILNKTIFLMLIIIDIAVLIITVLKIRVPIQLHCNYLHHDANNRSIYRHTTFFIYMLNITVLYLTPMSISIAMIVTLLHLTYKKIYLYSVRYLRKKWYLYKKAQFEYKSLPDEN